jgi:hypothetical protein
MWATLSESFLPARRLEPLTLPFRPKCLGSRGLEQRRVPIEGCMTDVPGEIALLVSFNDDLGRSPLRLRVRQRDESLRLEFLQIKAERCLL